MCPVPGSGPQILLYLICDYILMLNHSDAIINGSSNFSLNLTRYIDLFAIPQSSGF